MFRKEKTTQIAAKLLMPAGGSMPYISLIKLLYIADRKMLTTWGTPMTFDTWFAMPWGPVLSDTLDHIKAIPQKGDYWSSHITTRGYDVSLAENPGDDLLSSAEDEIITATFNEHGDKDWRDLVQYTHEFPEWTDPSGSSRRITYEEVLVGAGFSEDEIADIVDSIESEKRMDEIGHWKK